MKHPDAQKALNIFHTALEDYQLSINRYQTFFDTKIISQSIFGQYSLSSQKSAMDTFDSLNHELSAIMDIMEKELVRNDNQRKATIDSAATEIMNQFNNNLIKGT